MEPVALQPVVSDEPRRLGRRGVTLIGLVALIVGLGAGIMGTLFYRLLPEDDPQASSFFTNFQPDAVLQSATAKAKIQGVAWSVSSHGGNNTWGNRRELHVNHFTADGEMNPADQGKFATALESEVQAAMGRQGAMNFGSGGSSTSTSGGSYSSMRHSRQLPYVSGGKHGRLEMWVIGENKKVTVIFSLIED